MTQRALKINTESAGFGEVRADPTQSNGDKTVFNAPARSSAL